MKLIRFFWASRSMFDYFILRVFLRIYILRGLFIFSSRHKHLLVTLLRLEYIILNVFIVLVIGVRLERGESFLTLVFLVFAVSEGSIGLSLLVSLSRSHGTDMIKSYRTVW